MTTQLPKVNRLDLNFWFAGSGRYLVKKFQKVITFHFQARKGQESFRPAENYGVDRPSGMVRKELRARVGLMLGMPPVPILEGFPIKEIE